jgi:hypothetical protein
MISSQYEAACFKYFAHREGFCSLGGTLFSLSPSRSFLRMERIQVRSFGLDFVLFYFARFPIVAHKQRIVHYAKTHPQQLMDVESEEGRALKREMSLLCCEDVGLPKKVEMSGWVRCIPFLY